MQLHRYVVQCAYKQYHFPLTSAFFGQAFFNVGFSGMIYCVDVVTADISSLNNRALAYAFTSSPYIITAFAGPAASEAFYEQINFRWGFGIFAIILPFVAMLTFVPLFISQRKAKAQGLVTPGPQRTLVQAVKHFVIECDGTSYPSRIDINTRQHTSIHINTHQHTY